jgi:translocation and assembly module TamB
MKKPLKLVLSGISLLLGICLFSGILLSGYLHTDHARIHLLNFINHRIHGKISIQNHRISLLKGELEIWNARIYDSSENDLICLDNLLIDFSWIGLISEHLEVQRIIISNPDVKLSILSEGSLNLLNIFPIQHSEQTSDAGIFSYPVVFNEIKVIGGSSCYDDRQENLSICLQNMDMTLSADLMKQTGYTDIRIGSGHISSPEIHTMVGPVSIQASLKDGDILPLQFSLLSPMVNAEISGTISSIWEVPELSLNLKFNTALTALQQSLNLETALSGRVQIAGNISGSLFNPNADLNLTSEQTTLGEYSLNHLWMAANLKDRILSLETISRTTGKGAIHITGTADLKQAFASGRYSQPCNLSSLSGHAQVILENMNMEAIHPPAAGVVNGTLSLQINGYPEHDLKGDIGIDLQAERISLNPDIEPMDIRIHSRSRWDSDTLHIQQFQAQAGSTRLTASGVWNASSNHISGNLTCQSDNLSKSLSPLGIRGASGSLDILAKLSGSLERPECTLKLKSSGLGLDDIQIGSLAVDAEIEPSGMLRIDSLSLKNRDSELTAKGEIPVYINRTSDSRKPISFASTFHRIQPANFFRSSDIQGIIDGTCKLEGTQKSLSGSMQIQATGMKAQSVRLGNIVGDLKLADGKIQSQRLSLENRDSHADFSGMIQIFEPGSLSLHRIMPFQLSGSGMTLIAENFVDFIKGKITASAELEGTRTQIRGSMNLRSGQLEIGQQRFRQKLAAMELSADFNNNQLHISKANFSFAPDEFLNVSGGVASDSSFHVELSANGISLGHIDALTDYRSAGDGKLFLNLTGTGRLDHPKIQGEILLNPFRFYEIDWGHTRIEFKVADDAARFQLHSPVTGFLSCQLQNRDYAAELDFSRIELAPFFKFAGIEKIGGTVSGQISASGNLNSWKTLKADAGISELSLNAIGHSLVSGRNLHIGIQNEAVTIPRTRLSLLTDGSLDIGGESRIGQDVSLNLNADIPLNAAVFFNDGISDLRGNLILSAVMKGPWHNPDTEALLEIKNAGAAFEDRGQDIHDVNGRIHLTPKTIGIEFLEGQVNSGRIWMEGKAAIEAFKMHSMNLKMTASQVPIKIEDTLDATLNGELSLNGTAQSSILQGEIVILDGLYYKKVNLNPIRSLLQRERGYQARSEIIFPPAIQNTQMDIRIPPRNLFVVDNNLAQLNLSPDMRITGTLQRPVIQGRTSVDSGSIQYQSTTFSIKKGFIDFTNPYTMESVLDIQSQASIQNWTVFLDISGPLDKLNLKLSASPFLDDNDLLSLLVTGKTTRASLSKTTGGSSSQKMLADLLSTAVGSDIKKASGLDILEVDSTGENRNVNGDPLKVTFGKVISPQITLKYTVESKGGITFQRTITEYMFIENILLSGFQDSRGVFGGEVKYRHEFR